MLMYIIKRDGRRVPFNVEKIANAIFKAAKAVGGTNYEELRSADGFRTREGAYAHLYGC